LPKPTDTDGCFTCHTPSSTSNSNFYSQRTTARTNPTYSITIKTARQFAFDIPAPHKRSHTRLINLMTGIQSARNNTKAIKINT